MGDSSETQEKIITSALKLFAQQGYNGTTTSEIAKDCGVAEGTIFKYYKTKKILLENVLKKIVTEIAPGILFSTQLDVSQFTDPEATKQYIKNVIVEKLTQIKENFNCFRVVVTELQYHEDLKKTYTSKIIPRGVDMLEGFYNLGVQQGVFRKIDSHVAIRSFLGSMVIMMLDSVVLNNNISFEKDLDVIFDIFMNGFGVRKEG
jgi:AcrR family transcriptional regulator